MNRENRYLVLKRTDIESGLTSSQKKMLESLVGMVEEARSDAGKTQLKCVVIESDWPEYEPVWAMLARRVEPLAQPSRQQRDAALKLLNAHNTMISLLQASDVLNLNLSQGNYMVSLRGSCRHAGAMFNKPELQRLINELQVLCDAMTPPNHQDTGTYS